MSEPRDWTKVQWLSEVVANYLEHCRAEYIRPCQEAEQALRRLILEHGQYEKAVGEWRMRITSILALLDKVGAEKCVGVLLRLVENIRNFKLEGEGE